MTGVKTNLSTELKREKGKAVQLFIVVVLGDSGNIQREYGSESFMLGKRGKWWTVSPV